MAVRPTVTDAEGFGKELLAASPDLLGSMVKMFAEALMGADVDGLCNAEYGEVSPERVNRRNGYRMQGWDTRAGTLELAVPKLRQGSYFPEWLLTRRRRAEADTPEIRMTPEASPHSLNQDHAKSLSVHHAHGRDPPVCRTGRPFAASERRTWYPGTEDGQTLVIIKRRSPY